MGVWQSLGVHRWTFIKILQFRSVWPCHVFQYQLFFVKNASRARTRVQWEKCTCGNLSLNLENTLKSRTRSCARVTLAPLQWDGKEKEESLVVSGICQANNKNHCFKQCGRQWQRQWDCVYKLSTRGNEGGEFEFPLGALPAINQILLSVCTIRQDKRG